MGKSQDLHFQIHDHIEKYMPQKGSSGDIKKCIYWCEKGMDNLPNFIQECQGEYSGHEKAIPPSIYCRDVLVEIYSLYLNDFNKATDIINRAYKAGSWEKVQYEEELNRINRLASAHSAIIQILKENKNVFRKDIGKLLPNKDCDSLRAVGDHSLMIDRRKEGKYIIYTLQREKKSFWGSIF